MKLDAGTLDYLDWTDLDSYFVQFCLSEGIPKQFVTPKLKPQYSKWINVLI